MKKAFIVLFSGIFSLAMLLFFIGSFVSMHESAHQNINARFGLDSNVECDFTKCATVVSLKEYNKLGIAEKAQMEGLNAENEIAGYNSFPFYFLFIAL